MLFTLRDFVLFWLAWLAVGAVASAQHIPTVSNDIFPDESMPERTIILLQNSWLISGNPAGIGANVLPDLGLTQVGGNIMGGDYHRVQESASATSLGFATQSYKSLESVHLFGDLVFKQERRNDLRFSDNLDPYNGNPYVLGSDLAGDYANQSFQFKVNVSSRPLFDFVWVGLGTDYLIGDHSRLQDPRARTPFVDLNLRPGIIFKLPGGHKVGMNFLYRYKKEKIEGYVSKAQEPRDYLIFRQEGLGVYQPIVSNYINRRIKGQYLGPEFQYEYRKYSRSLFLMAGAQFRKDAIEDPSRSSPGGYTDNVYFGKTRYLNANQNRIYLIELGAQHLSGDAEKAFQEVVTRRDEVSGVISSYYKTLFSVQSFTTDILQANLQYKYYSMNNDEDFRWYAGGDVSYTAFENAYVYLTPKSTQLVGAIESKMLGGWLLLDNVFSQVCMHVSAGYLLNLKNELSVSQGLSGDMIKEYVLMPDAEVLGLNALSFSIELGYARRLSSHSNYKLYISSYLQNYFSIGAGHRYVAGFSVGLLH
jgi:hypothetical protein